MSKAQIFISHINEEADYANELKEWIEETLLGGVSLFVSSDKGASIPLGSEWPQEIKKSLELSSIVLVLVSYKSITRKWIYFESGAGYVRGIPVIPICIGGLKKTDLPIPLNFLQSIELPNHSDEEILIKKIAGCANLRSPKEIYQKLNLPNRIIEKEENFQSKEENKNSNSTIVDIILESEIKILVIQYFIKLENYRSQKFTLSKLEIELGLKGKNRRKQILNFLEELNQYKCVEKIKDKQSTQWAITETGKEKLEIIQKRLTQYDLI